MFSPPQKQQENPSGIKSEREELLKSGQVLFLPTEESEQGVHQQNICLEVHSQLTTHRDEPNKVQTILNTEFKDEGDPILVGDQRSLTIQSIAMKESAKQIDISIPKKKEISVEVASFNSQQNPADFPVKETSKQPSISTLKKTTFMESSIKEFDQQHQGFFFQRTKNVNKFIQKIKSKTSSFLMTLVTRNVFNLINDLSSDFFVFTNQRAFKLLGKEMSPFRKYFMRGTRFSLKIMDSSYGVFHPENQIILIWEMFFAIYLLSQIIIQPLRDSFPENFRGYNSPALYFHEKILPFIAFLIDSFIVFNTAVFKKGQLMKTRIDIFKKNISKRFLWESFIIAFYLIGAFLDGYFFFEYFILLKFVDFFSLIKKFSEIYDHNRQKLIYTQSAQIICQILLVAHVSASIFITVAKGSAPAITWLDKLKEVTQISNPTASQIYVSGLYWSIITMVTLGYGDIVPISFREKLFVICVAFVSCALFGYSFNLIGEIINESRKNKTKLKNDLEMLNSLMEDRGLNHELKSKVRRYFAYLQKEKLKNFEIGQEMIGALPPALKDEVMYDLYSKLLKSLPLFSENFSEQFIQELSLCIKEFKTGPELIIQKKNTIQDKLYFIIRGEVMQYWDSSRNSDSCIEILKKGNTIGLHEFITQTPIEYFSKSESVTSISYFTYEEFLEILAKHPKDNEMYYKIKDKINIYQQGTLYKVECPFCKKGSHFADQCPLIRYQPNTGRLHLEYKKLELVKQERNSCKKKRLHKLKINSLSQHINMVDCAYMFMNDLQAEMDDSVQQLNIQFDSNTNNYIPQQQEKIEYEGLQAQQPEREDTVSPIKIKTQNQIRKSILLPQQHQQQQQILFLTQPEKVKEESKQLSEISSSLGNSEATENVNVPTAALPESKIIFYQPKVNNPIEDSVDFSNEVEQSRYGAISAFMQTNKQKKPDFSICAANNNKNTDSLSQVIEKDRSKTISMNKPSLRLASAISGGFLGNHSNSEKNIQTLMKRLTSKEINVSQALPSSSKNIDNNNNNNNNNNSNSNSNNQNLMTQVTIAEEETTELPFMIIDQFDRFYNYQFYFTHNNLRQILRDCEEKRLAYLEKKRKGKISKKTYPDKQRMLGSVADTKKK